MKGNFWRKIFRKGYNADYPHGDAAITHEDCSITDVISTAKHFFELGLKVKKGK